MNFQKLKTILYILSIMSVFMMLGCSKFVKNIPEVEIEMEKTDNWYKPPVDFVETYRDEITEISFVDEYNPYGEQKFAANVIIQKSEILYTYSLGKSDKANELRWSKELNEVQWEAVLQLLDKYKVGLWEEQLKYENLRYGGAATSYEVNIKAEFPIQGSFFNIATVQSFTEAMPFVYLGMDENTRRFRSSSKGTLCLKIKDDRDVYLKSYYGYAVPPGYNAFCQELWDYIIALTGSTDWRLEIDQWGKETLHDSYPYLLENRADGKPQLCYFSLLESYGGKNEEIPILFIYDGGNKSFSYKCLWDEKTYSINAEEMPEVYKENPSKFFYDTTDFYGRSVAYLKEDDTGHDVLEALIEKYQVFEWGNDEIDTQEVYVEQGQFFNHANAVNVIDEVERELREGYDSLIHLVYSDGTHVEIKRTNGELPEQYNDFRMEFWNFFIPYIYKQEYQQIREEYEKNPNRSNLYSESFIKWYMEYKVPEIEQKGWDDYLIAEDWRNQIDRWGKEYMQLK